MSEYEIAKDIVNIQADLQALNARLQYLESIFDNLKKEDEEPE